MYQKIIAHMYLPNYNMQNPHPLTSLWEREASARQYSTHDYWNMHISAHFRHACDFIGAQCPVLKSCDCIFVVYTSTNAKSHMARHNYVYLSCTWCIYLSTIMHATLIHTTCRHSRWLDHHTCKMSMQIIILLLYVWIDSLVLALSCQYGELKYSWNIRTFQACLWF